MKNNLEIFQIDVFTREPFQGNAAAVTFGENLSKEQMQSIAREMNLSETAFLTKSDIADYNLRWFTPSVEVELCGHATIASLHFLKEKNILKNNSPITFNTRSGILNCKYESGKYFMQVPIYSMEEFKGNLKEILDILGIKENEIDQNIPALIMENENLYIYVNKLETLKKLKPDFTRLKNLCADKREFGGAVVFTLETFDKESFAHSRYFVPFYGIDEDPVTGSTNGPLLNVLLKMNLVKEGKDDISLTFEQGDIINRKGRVGVHFSKSKNKLFISGNAVTVMKGVLTF